MSESALELDTGYEIGGSQVNSTRYGEDRIHQTLAETIPLVQIRDFEALSETKFRARMPHPGFCPDLDRVGLALSQVGNMALHHSGKVKTEKNCVPMVRGIKTLVQAASANNAFANSFTEDLVLEVEMDGMNLKGFVYDSSGVELASTEMELFSFPPTGLKKLRDRSEKSGGIDVAELENGSEFVPYYDQRETPGFNSSFNRTNITRSTNEEIGRFAFPEIDPDNPKTNLFPGHFSYEGQEDALDTAIIPIAGTFSPIAQAIKEWRAAEIRESGNNLEAPIDITVIDDMEVPVALFPGDRCHYKIENHGNGVFSATVYYEKDGNDGKELHVAARFGTIKAEATNRKSNPWPHPNAERSYRSQEKIPGYTDHLDTVSTGFSRRVLDTIEPEKEIVKFADVGTGAEIQVAKRVINQVLESGKCVEVVLTEVSQGVIDSAKTRFNQVFAEEIEAGTVVLGGGLTPNNPGNIIPRALDENLDGVVSNFAFYGNQKEALEKLYAKLKIGGVATLGLVHPNPNYRYLQNVEAERIRRGELDMDMYWQEVLMAQVAAASTEKSFLAVNEEELLTPAGFTAVAGKIGFDVQIQETDSFYGVGFIIELTKKVK